VKKSKRHDVVHDRVEDHKRASDNRVVPASKDPTTDLTRKKRVQELLVRAFDKLRNVTQFHVASAAAALLLLGAAVTAFVLLYERVNVGIDPKDNFSTLVGLSSPQIVASLWPTIAYFFPGARSRRAWRPLSALVILVVLFICSFLPAGLIYLQGKNELHLLFSDFALIFGGVQSVVVALTNSIGRRLFERSFSQEDGVGAQA
jgi:hypothetical protein